MDLSSLLVDLMERNVLMLLARRRVIFLPLIRRWEVLLFPFLLRLTLIRYTLDSWRNRRNPLVSIPRRTRYWRLLRELLTLRSNLLMELDRLRR